MCCPTLAVGDGWIATMQHLARENRMFVVGVNRSCTPTRSRPLPPGPAPPGFLGRTVPGWKRATPSSSPNGTVLVAQVREREETRCRLDLLTVAIQRRHLDPAGHYNRPDVFRLNVDTSPRPPVVETSDASLTQAMAAPQNTAPQNVALQHVAAQNSE